MTQTTIEVPAFVRDPRATKAQISKHEENYIPFKEVQKNPKLAVEVIESEMRELVPAIQRVHRLALALGGTELIGQVLTILSGKSYPEGWTMAERIAHGNKRRKRTA